MSGNFPTSPGPASFALTSKLGTVTGMSESGKRQARLVGGHIWEIRLTYGTMPQAKWSPMDAFIMLQDGNVDSFDYTYPIDNQGTWIDETPVVNGVVSAGATSINFDGLTAGVTTIVAGDIFRPDGHDKVYKVVTGGTAGADSDVLKSDGTGFILLNDGTSHILMNESRQVTCEVRPAFIEDVADNETLSHTDVQFRMSIKGVHKFNASAPNFYTYVLDLEESL